VPRYYFHVGELGADPEGTVLADLKAARSEAVLAARELLAGYISAGRDVIPMKIVIADEANQVLGTVHMRDVLPRALRETD
jgi:hypothetical protein